MRLTILVSIALTLHCTVAVNAQTIGGPDARIKLAEPDVKDCADDNDCAITITAETYVGDDGKEHCRVKVPYLVTLVGKGKHPKVKWEFDSSKAQFRYHKNKDGIELDKNNDTNHDFKDGAEEGNNHDVFKWKAVNDLNKKKAISYNVNVIRRSDDLVCDAADPVIVNMGN